MERILVVEDDEMVRGSLVDILSSASYQVDSAANGKFALMAISENLPDLIISDIMMPEVDGITLFREVQHLYSNVDIPFIFLTAKAEFCDIRTGMSIGADDYITKPFKVKDLLQTVNTRLIKKQKRKEKEEELTSSLAKYVPHELRTPLVSIIGYSECIMTDPGEYTKSEIVTMVKHISKSAERLKSRVDKFLTYADLNNNPDPILKEEKSESEIDVMIKQILSEKSPHYSGREITTELFHCAVNLPMYHLRILLEELIENALKFSPDKGKVVIRLNPGEDVLRLDIENESNYYIPYPDIKSIPLFRQFDRDENQQIGNGIGLSIVNKICEMFDLETRISDEDGKIKLCIKFPKSEEKGDVL